MKNTLIVYSTTDGHTLEICRRMQAILEAQQHHVDRLSLGATSGVDLEAYDKFVIGASIRYGNHHPALVKFLQANGATLCAHPNAFFSVNLVARKPEKSQPDTNPYMIKLLRQLSWRPAQLAVFAGKIDYPRYGLLDRQIIRLIMWLTDGPTGPRDVIDFTDWSQVDAFANVIASMGSQ